MQKDRKRLILYSLLVLASGSVLAMSGLFKITSNLISTQASYQKLKVYQYTYTYFNVTNNTELINIVRNFELNNTYPINIFAKEIIVNSTYNVNPFILVKLKSIPNFGRKIILAIAYPSYKNTCLTIGNLIKTIFLIPTEIKTKNNLYLCVTNFEVCENTNIYCELTDNSNYTNTYAKYFVLIIFGPGNTERAYNLEIEVGLE